MPPICGLIHGFNYGVINKNMTVDEYNTIRKSRFDNIFIHTQNALLSCITNDTNDDFGKYAKDIGIMLRTPYVEDCPIQNHMYDFGLYLIVDSMKISKVKSFLWCWVKPKYVRDTILGRPYKDGNTELMDAYNALLATNDNNDKYYFLLFHMLRFCILNQRKAMAEDQAMKLRGL